MDARVEAKEKSTAQRAPQAPPCTMVIFGAGGDLTKRLLMPALYNLAKDKLLSDNFAIIAADRTPKPADAFRDYLAEGVRSFVSDTGSGARHRAVRRQDMGFHRQPHHPFRRRFHHARYLQQACGSAQKDRSGNPRPAAMSCSTSPSPSNCSARSSSASAPPDWLRKRTAAGAGSSSKSRLAAILPPPRALNARILKVLDEPQIFRMDHFLGKETVQNIMALRFSNAIFEPLWNRDHIDHVQITAAETVGVERRANFYEVTGALRDMVPNHVFQLLSLTAMESPNSFAADAVRNEKTKVLEAVQPLDDEAVRRNVVRGQYAAGAINGAAVQAYRQEPGVKPDSMTETYVALRLGIENWRWAGVPFYLRTGKRLTRRTTEIAIHFKQAPFALFRDTPGRDPDPQRADPADPAR